MRTRIGMIIGVMVLLLSVHAWGAQQGQGGQPTAGKQATKAAAQGKKNQRPTRAEQRAAVRKAKAQRDAAIRAGNGN